MIRVYHISQKNERGMAFQDNENRGSLGPIPADVNVL